MMNEDRKILVYGLKFDKNIGDAIIGENLVCLIGRCYPNTFVAYEDLKGRDSFNPRNNFLSKVFKFLQFKMQPLKNLFRRLSFYSNGYIKLKRKFYSQIRTVDYVIFAGGGIIECTHYDCDLYINLIYKISKKLKKPLIFNAVGFNGHYDRNNNSYIKLKKILNAPIVRYISVRENVEEMQKYTGRICKLVCDPACWSKITYETNKKTDSDIIGINLIRPSIFNEFGFEISENCLMRLYKDIIIELKGKGYKVQLFTNGTDSDIAFGKALISSFPELELDEILSPTCGRDLVGIISKYAVILSARMHATIVSYALDIPSINLCWNEKLLHFYKNIGFEDRLFTVDNFDYKSISEKIIKNFRGNCSNEKRKEFMNSIILSINEWGLY